MKNTAIAKIFVISAVLGLLIGLVMDLFIRLLKFVTNHVWQNILPDVQSHKVAVLLITLIGGILMGICVKYVGTNEGIGFEAVMVAVTKDGGMKPVQLIRVVVNSFVGLVSGASIGPEAPIVTLGGYAGDFVARRLKLEKEQIMAFIAIALGGSLGVLLDSPVAGAILFAERKPTPNEDTNKVLIFASMIAASMGFGLYLLLKGSLISNLTLIPHYDGFKFVQLLYALIIGVLGTFIGLTMKLLIVKLKVFFARFDKYPISRGALVGLFTGVWAIFFPLILFDGSSQLSQIVTHVSQYSILMLLALGVIRLLTTSVSLSGGYQGGNIFPTIFITGVIGLAINGIFPFIPAPVAMMACMIPAMYTFLPLPLFTIFLFTELSSFSLIPVMSFAMISAYLVFLFAKPQLTKLGLVEA